MAEETGVAERAAELLSKFAESNSEVADAVADLDSHKTEATREDYLQSRRIAEKKKELEQGEAKTEGFRTEVLKSYRTRGLKAAAEKNGFANSDFIVRLLYSQAASDDEGNVTISTADGPVAVDDFLTGMTKKAQYKHLLKGAEPQPKPFVPSELKIPEKWDSASIKEFQQQVLQLKR